MKKRVSYLGALALSAVAGCSPSAPTVVVPIPTPASGPMVRGTVWQYGGPDGVAPASSGSVFAWIEGAGSRSTTVVPIATDGRFQFTAPEGARVHLTGSLPQPCAASAVIAGDVALDLHVVADSQLLGANLPAALSAQQPTLSGTVYQRFTDQSRGPLPNVSVQLDTLSGLGPIIARTRTDAQGRYVLCGMPAIPGLSVTAWLIDYEFFRSSGSLTGVTTLDIEMRLSGIDSR